MKKPDKLPRDANQLAKQIVELSTGEASGPPPKPTAKTRGRRTGGRPAGKKDRPPA